MLKYQGNIKYLYSKIIKFGKMLKWNSLKVFYYLS